MFNRRQIKENARFVLRRSYMTGLAVIFIMVVVSMGASMASAFVGMVLTMATSYASEAFTGSGFWNSELIPVIMFTVTELAAFASVFFVALPAAVGVSNYFISTREQTNPVTAEYFSWGFKSNYLNKAKAMFTTSLIVWLWSLIGAVPMAVGTVLADITGRDVWLTLTFLSPFMMIPAFIAAYRYRMVSFILANNGSIKGRRARELSNIMTSGNKWNLFVMDLSFLGWMLLGMIACYIGVMFVMPYIMATYAEAYTCLKAEAIQIKGATDENELPPLRAVGTLPLVQPQTAQALPQEMPAAQPPEQTLEQPEVQPEQQPQQEQP